MKYTLILFLSLLTFPLFCQTSAYNFESTTLPSQLSAQGSVSIGTEHLRKGSKALKWVVANNQALTIDMGATCSYYRVIYIPIYSFEANKDKLILRFYKDSAKKQLAYQSEMKLNYKGWREFHKFIQNDFSTSMTTSGYRCVEITFESTNSSKRTLWLDDINLAASYASPYNIRIPGPHMESDYQKNIFSNNSNLEDTYLKAYFRTVDTPSQPTQEEINGYETVAKAFRIDDAFINYGGSVTSAAKNYLSTTKCTEAINYVNQLNIHANSDGSLNGVPFENALYTTPDKLVNISYQVLALSYGAQTNKNTNAKAALLLFTRYILDQGIAEGGRLYVPFNSYAISRHFVLGFLHAMPIYQAEDKTLAEDVIKMLRWAYTFGYVYGNYTPDLTSDFIYVKSRYLFSLADFQPTTAEKIRDVKSIVKYYENCIIPIDGPKDLIKPDGSGYHHSASHNSYMYVFQNWIGDLYKLKNTPFMFNMEAYKNVSLFVSNHFLQCASNQTDAVYANSLCGRGPFVNSNKVGYANWKRLIEMGGLISKVNAEPEMAALYNAVTQTKTYANQKETAINGVYQMNYSNMGFVRNNNWVATFKGFCDLLWGTEIYATANRYGRYQSYGALEILYNKEDIVASSGYPASAQPSWDWNTIPGTTTVHIDYTRLNPNSDRADEVQYKDFSGALAFGPYGIFTMDFEEDATDYWNEGSNRYMPSKLTFKKSVFVYNDMLLALGSNISASLNYISDFTATNLCQEIVTNTNSKFLYNNQNVTFGDNKSFNLSQQAYTLLTPCGTGYYIPKQAGTLQLVYEQQSTPLHNHARTATPTYVNSNAAKAWIKHSNGKNEYEYVVFPASTAETLKDKQTLFEKGKAGYSIRQKDEKAHVVFFEEAQLTGYNVFENYESDTDLVRQINAPALCMIKRDHDQLSLAICNPSLNVTKHAVYNWISTPKVVEILLDGLWQVANDNAACTYVNKQTKLTFYLSGGQKQEISLFPTTNQVSNCENEKVNIYKNNNSLIIDKTVSLITVYSLSGEVLYKQKDCQAGQICEIPPYTTVLVQTTNRFGNISIHKL